MSRKMLMILSTALGIVVLTILMIVLRPFSSFEERYPMADASATPTAVPAADEAKESNSEPEENVPEATPSIINPAGDTLKTRINTPDGFKRTKEEKGSLARFLRKYKLKRDGGSVRLYNGKKKKNQDAHVAVFKLPLEKEDLQQCADSVMRVFAEYYWHTDQKDKISFALGYGFEAAYSKWREGYRISVGNTSYSWVDSAPFDDSYENFVKYLRIVFAYAGTESMVSETTKIKKRDISVGDVFLQGGNPGHVVMVVDTCIDESGHKAFLLAQGFMPAQQFHVLKNPAHDDDPWYYVDELKYPFDTPEFTFKKGSLRRLYY